MKKLFLFISFLISLVAAGQPQQSLGNANNIVVTQGYGGVKKGQALMTSWADTTAMNLDNFLKTIAGVQARSGDTIWQRSNDLTRWFRTGAGSIITGDSPSIVFEGDGSDGDPLTANIVASSISGNAVQVMPDGVFVPSFTTDGVTSGGLVNWVVDYNYEVSPTTYIIQGVGYSAPYTELTLANSDPTNDRLDLVVVNTDEEVTVITGTPAEDPLLPSYDVKTQLYLGFILVSANTTEPNPLPDFDYIYLNNNEWTSFSSSARINVASTNSPYSPTLDVEASSAENLDYVSFTAVSPVVIGDYNMLTFKIRTKAQFPNYTRLQMQFVTGGGVLIGNPVSINNNGPYGFISSSTSAYQTISIPLTSFGALTNVTALRFTVVSQFNRVLSFYLDNIQLINGIVSTTGEFFQQQGNSFGVTGVLGTNDANALSIETNNTERLLITSAGDFQFKNLDTDNTAPQVAAVDASGNLVWRDVSSFLGSVVNVITDSSIAICSYVSNVASNCDTTIINNVGAIQTVTIMNDSTIIVCGPSLCDTLVVPQANFNPGINANNGLTMSTPTNVQLGGTLLATTTITAGAFNLIINGSSASSSTGVLRVEHTGGTGRAIFATTNGAASSAIQGQQLGGGTGISGTGTSGNGISGTATTGVGVRGTATSGVAGLFQTTTGVPLDIQNSHTTTTGNEILITARRATSGAATDNISGSFNFELEGTVATNISNQLISEWTTAATDTRVSRFIITGVDNAVTADLFTLSGNGQTKLNKYGVNTFAGTPAYAIGVEADGDLVEFAVGGAATTIYTGDGSLASNRTVSTAGFTTTWTGSNDSETLFSVVNTGATTASAISGTASGTTSIGVSGTSTSYIAVLGTSTSGTGIQGASTSGTGVVAVSTTGVAFGGQINPSSTNSVENAMYLRRTTSAGAGANGIGAAIQFELETASSGTSNGAGKISYNWTDATNATRTSQVIIAGVNSAANNDILTLSGNGGVRFNDYGINTFAGVAAYVLGVDASGNVVEVAAAGAGMTNVLTTTGDIIYSSSGTTPARLGIGTAGQVLTVNAGATAVEWTTVGGTGTVTSIGQSFTGGLISVSGSPVTTTGTLALTVAGTSGAGVYFSSTSTWASTALLADNAIMIGGGAGSPYETTTTGTGVLTALGVNVGSAGAFVTFNGALGTPSSGTLTNATGLPISSGISGLGTGVATALAVNTGSVGAFVLFNGAGGTPTSLTLTNATGLPLTTGVTGTLDETNGGTGIATYATGDVIYATGVNALGKLAAGTNGQVLTLIKAKVEIINQHYYESIWNYVKRRNVGKNKKV